MLDVTTLKLGKKAPLVDERTLKAERLFAGLPTPPPSLSWFGDVTNWGMMLNDTLGNCTCAAIGHGDQVVSLNTPVGLITPPDVLILNLYEHACGYVPGDPSTDQGGVIIDVLNYVRKNGLGHKRKPYPHKKKFPLFAYADPSPNSTLHIMQSVQTFGIVDIGLQLPVSAQSQVGGVWDVVGDPKTDANSQPGSWGGHSVIVAAYDSVGPTCITWGQLQKMTWAFWNTYCDESHALLFNFWLDHFTTAWPLVLKQLEADLALVAN
jgi:hypothetical protein